MQSYYYNKLSTHLYNNKLNENDFFTKTTLFDKLNLHLYSNNEKCVLLYGAGGMGKTTLARQYGNYLSAKSKTFITKYFKMDSISFIVTNYIESLFNQLDLDTSVLKTTNLPLCLAMINQKLIDYYENNDLHFLFIFDNIKNENDHIIFLKLILKDMPSNVKTICITKSNSYNFMNIFDYQIEVKPFSRDDARNFLLNSLKNSINYHDLDLILSFFENELFIPYELKHIVEIIRKNQNSNPTELVKQSIHDKISFYLFIDIFLHSNVDRFVLMNIAFFNTFQIQEKFIQKISKINRDKLTNSLNRIENLSIIKRVNDENMSEDRYFNINETIHIKLKYFIKKYVTQNDLESFFNTNVTLFLNIFSNNSTSNSIQANIFLNENNLMHIRNFLDEFDIDNCIEKTNKENIDNEAMLYQLIGDIYKEKYLDFTTSVVYFKKALNFLEKNYKDDVKMVIVLNKIGLCYQLKHDFENSVLNFTKAINIMNTESLNKAILLNNLGLCYLDLEDYENSQKYLNQSFEMIKKLSQDKTFNSIILNNIGANYRYLGTFQNFIF
jgi:tetratricopeptide (TPR) repeat protein